MNILRRDSPNHDARPEGTPIDTIVLHYTGMQSAEAALDRLCEPQAAVSAHYVVGEDGTVWQLVEEGRRAWHAGVSFWRGQTALNGRSIGIEIVNPGHAFGYRGFPHAQMRAVRDLCVALQARHPIDPRNVVAHSDIAPDRKQDPGELFGWAWLARSGVGLWTEAEREPEPGATLTTLLAEIGYDTTLAEAPAAFQRRFRPSLIDGLEDPQTLRRAVAVAEQGKARDSTPPPSPLRPRAVAAPPDPHTREGVSPAVETPTGVCGSGDAAGRRGAGGETPDLPFSLAHPTLARALAERGYTEATDVQASVLRAPAERDLLVSAQTGSGKTVAFGLAIASTLMSTAEHVPAAGPPLALIVAPTRELALQVSSELAWLYAPARARIATCVGGMDPRRERDELGRGTHIVVGTPGRLRDHIERAQLDTTQLRAVVLDEADEMLDLGFRDDLEFILKATPSARRTLLFSATIAGGIAKLAQNFQRDAIRLDTVRRDRPHADIAYRALRIPMGQAEKATVNVLRYYASPGALVFCGTREAVRHMHASLQERGFAAVALSGELSQHERNRALSALRDGRAQVCIATDVAARGLDLPSLDLVIHADLPGSRETLLHRSGRTGRAGRKGVCVVLVPADRQRRASTLFAAAGIAAAWEDVPTPDQIRAQDEQRLLADPVFADPPGPEELAAARALIAERGAEPIVAALLRMVRARLPEAEETAAPAAPAPRAERPRRGEKAARPPAMTESVRFRVSLGRRHKADPKWLLPLLCKAGGVSREMIGRIEIGERDSLFEVAASAAPGFAHAAAQATDQEVRIGQVGANARPKEKSSRKRG